MKNPLYNIVAKFFNQSFDTMPVTKKKTKATKQEEAKNYYLIELKQSKDQFEFRGDKISILNHHVSIYETQARNESNGMSSIHYTANCCNARGRRYIVHVYFDRYGSYVETQVKDVTAGVRVPVEDAQFKSHAILTAGLLVHQLSTKCQEESRALLSRYEKMEAEACVLSKSINFSSINLNDMTVKKYMICIRACIVLQENLNAYAFEPSDTIVDVLRDMLKRIQRMHTEQSENKRKDETNLMSSDKSKAQQVTNKVKSTDNKPKKKQPDRKSKQTVEKAKPSRISQYYTEIETLKQSHDRVHAIIRIHEIYNVLTQLHGNNLNGVINAVQGMSENLKLAQEEFDACLKRHDLDGVKALVKLPKINMTFKECVMLAAEKQTELLSFCIDRFKINVNTYEPLLLPDGHSLIVIAVTVKDLPTFKMLLAKGADPNTFYPFKGRNLLMTCCASGLTEFVRVLLQYPVQINAHEESRDFMVPLHRDAAENKEELIQMLEERRIGESTALILACQTGDEKLTRLLLDANADINATNVHGHSALTACAMNESGVFNLACLDLLLARGANINRIEGLANNKTTLLAYNVMKRRFDQVRVLLDRGADPNVFSTTTEDLLPSMHKQNFGRYRLPTKLTALHIALLKGYHEIFEHMMNHTTISPENIRAAKQLAIILGREEQYDVLNVKENDILPDSDQLKVEIISRDEDKYWLRIP